MKVTYAVIFSLISFTAVFAHPAVPQGSEEVEFVPLEDQSGEPVVDTGVIGGFSPFDGLFESLAGMMARMRQQMDYLLRRLPLGNSTSDESPFAGFPEFPGIDLSKGNTTSVTKTIDGHKVVINETTYKNEGPHHGAFFKVRVIDVLPDSSELTTERNAEEITTRTKDVESVENSYENEIPKNKETEVFSNIETFDDPDNVQPFRKFVTGNLKGTTLESFEDDSIKTALPVRQEVRTNQAYNYHPFQKITDGSSKWSTLETFSAEDNTIESAYRPPDLSSDTYVNQLMAENGAPTNPDAEVFSNVEYNVPYATVPRQRFEKITHPR